MKPFVAAVATAVFIIVISYLLWGFYFDEYEPTLAALFYGIPCYPMLHEWITGGHFLLTPVISWFSQILPGVPVYGIWICFLNFLWLSGLSWLLMAAFKSESSSHSKWKQALVVLIVFILSADCLVHFSFTRAAILMVGTALLSVEQKTTSSRSGKFFFAAVFVLGVLTRMSAALVILVFALAYSWMQEPSVKAIAKKYWLHALFIFLCVAGFNLGRLSDNSFGLALESKYEYAISESQLVPLGEMKTAEDSMKYVAVADYLVTDSANMNEAFVSKVLLVENHWKYLLMPGKWKEAVALAAQFAAQFWQVLVFQCMIFIAALYLSERREPLLLKVLMLQALFWMIVLVLAIIVDMFERFFSPFLSLLTLVMLLTCLPVFLEQFSGRLVKAAVLAGLVLAVLLYSPLSNFAAQSERQYQNHQLVLKNLKDYNGNNTVVFLGIQRTLFSIKPFHRDKESGYSNVIFADLANFSYFDFGKKRIIDRYGFSPLDYPAFCSYLKKNREGIIILASERRVKEWSQYLHVIYHCDVKLVFIKKEPLINDWCFYRIEM